MCFESITNVITVLESPQRLFLHINKNEIEDTLIGKIYIYFTTHEATLPKKEINCLAF